MSSDTVSNDSSPFLKPALTSIRTSSGSSSSSSRPSSSHLDKKNLRVLIVDDNFINLRTLSTLLNRRFSPFLAHPPVAVDSGLKAIQQMRSSVFDVVFMDIQMPFLSGLECTKRIRAGEDGILQSNSTANIVACTSCTGEAASASYRDTGFSGLIAKPVRFQDMSDFILPLSKEAFLAESVVDMISPFQDGHFIFPPLPPSLLCNARVFFDTTKPPSPKGVHLRSSSTLDEELLKVRNGQSSASAISNSEHFVLLLAAQTRASLKKNGAVIAARTGTVSGSMSNFSANHWRRKSSGLTGSLNELKHLGQFDKKVFAAQVAQEFEAANNYDSDGPSRNLSSSPSVHSDYASRPPCHHRLSSPAFLVESPDHDSSDSEFANDVPSINRPTSPKAVKKESRPSVDAMPRRPEFKSRSRDSTSNVFSSASSPGGSYHGWNHSSPGNTSSATSVDKGYEERQIYSSPLLAEFQKGFSQWKGLEGKTCDGIEYAQGQEGQTFLPRQGSTSTIDDDESSCSTPDEEDDSRIESLSFDGSRTFPKRQSAKFASIDHNQGLSAFKGSFHHKV